MDEIWSILALICLWIISVIFLCIWFCKESKEYEDEIESLTNQNKQLEKEKQEQYILLQKRRNEVARREFAIEMKMLVDSLNYSPDYRYKELIKLLKEIADFRETHYLDYDDKVLVLVPSKSQIKYEFKDLLKEGDDKND